MVNHGLRKVAIPGESRKSEHIWLDKKLVVPPGSRGVQYQQQSLFVEVEKEKGGKSIIWENSGIDEIGKRADTGKVVVKIDQRYFRPTEVEQLLGDSSKARKELKWKPKITLNQLVVEMIEKDSNEAKKESLLKNKGFSIYSSKE